MIDSNYLIETPEGIDLSIRPAGIIVRTLAFSIDFLIRVVTLLGLSLLLGTIGSGKVGYAFFLIAYFVLDWFYPVIFEVYSQGMTPGKKKMGIRVIHDDGTPVSWGSSVLRNLVRFADFLPFFYGAAFVSMSVDKRFRRLGDLAAGTVVAYVEDIAEKPDLGEGAVRVAPLVLDSEEQRSLISYAERAPHFSPDRNQELANLLQSLHEAKDEEGVERLQEIARGLAG